MHRWRNIVSEKDVDKIIEKSNERPQIIFKDSRSCGISAYAKERLDDGTDLMLEKADFNYLDLLSYRSVSNYISHTLKVTHQSPQVLVLVNGKVIYHNSHHAINAEKISDKINA